MLEKLIENNPNLTFWWRDDDAHQASKQLDALIALNFPIKLAVIPNKTISTFDLPNSFQVWQHGFDHTNHGSTIKAHKKCELSDTVSQTLLIQNLKLGQSKLRTLFPDHFENILVPPWNRIDPILGKTLTFYDAISSYYTNETYSDLPRQDCHIDLINWKTKSLKSFQEITTELLHLIELNITHIGFLSHHLIHSNTDFKQLKTLSVLLLKS